MSTITPRALCSRFESVAAGSDYVVCLDCGTEYEETARPGLCPSTAAPAREDTALTSRLQAARIHLASARGRLEGALLIGDRGHHAGALSVMERVVEDLNAACKLLEATDA